jgi:methanogenic corrinoid protein MtbC1
LGIAATGAEEGDWQDPKVTYLRQSVLTSALLARTIEGEIIPRLMLAHKAGAAHAAGPANQAWRPSAKEVADFTDLVLRHDTPFLMAHLKAKRQEGVSLEILFIDLLGPTARRLGDLWTEDRVGFTDVTVALNRLHRVVREMSSGFCEEIDLRDHVPRAFIVPAPGEQHSMGAVIVAELMRKSGWDVVDESASRPGDVADAVACDWYDMVGMSLSCDTWCEALADEVRNIKKHSRNNRIGVMVGGPYFAEHPEFGEQIGADIVASDGREAARQIEDLREQIVRAP